MNKVKILEATRKSPNSRARTREGGPKIEKVRVAAYCRVSTDRKEQIESFESQKSYYEKLISENEDWIMAGIFADEAVTGTRIEKRSNFLRMIDCCERLEIDLILTKSISRFARNTMDTLRYVRMLKDRNIAVLFEKENINTMDMNGEMLLTILSSLAQEEVQSLSGNVNKGLQMKMSRGELVGFNGCLGYDYNREDKSITINKEEAEVVQAIYDFYVQGYGANLIAKKLVTLGYKNKKGEIQWTASGVLGIIKNEKYKGDILLGKTFTTDPISKRRLANMGEQNQYYIEDHHEAIIPKEIWKKADEIRKKRSKNKYNNTKVNRERYTRQYSFSSMCECAYCGHKLTRRTRHSNSIYQKPVWQCMNATKNGIKSCPNCKAIDEKVIEEAFLEAFGLLAGKFDDVSKEVIYVITEVLKEDKSYHMKKEIDKKIAKLESRKSKMTDLFIDGTIEKETYDSKLIEITRKLHTFTERRNLIINNIENQKDVNKRLIELRKVMKEENCLDQFDRFVFDSVIEKVIVGGYDVNGKIDPYKLTFVLKGSDSSIIPNVNVNHSTEKYKQDVI